jgi:hypothetical protein
MKMKSRLEKIEQAIEQVELSKQPPFRVSLAGDKIPPPKRGTLDIVFHMPRPLPVPPELLREAER